MIRYTSMFWKVCLFYLGMYHRLLHSILSALFLAGVYYQPHNLQCSNMGLENS